MSIKFGCAVYVGKKGPENKPVREAQLEVTGVDSIGECIRKYGDAEVLGLIHAALVVKLQNNVARPMLSEKTDGGTWQYTVLEVQEAVERAVPSGERRAMTDREKQERKLAKMYSDMGISPEDAKPMIAMAMAKYDEAKEAASK